MPPSTIGVLSPFLEGPYYGELLTGIQTVAQQYGARLIAVQTAQWQDALARAVPTAWDRVDGWVGIVDGLSTAYLHEIQRSRKPVVMISASHPQLSCPVIVPDNHGGMAAAVRHLIEHGHQRIAFVGNFEQLDIRQRHQGYEAALREHGSAVDPQLSISAPDNLEAGGRDAAQRLLASSVQYSAVVAATDLNAIGVMEVLQAAGVRIPEDVAVIGFDDMDVAQYTTPPLTTMRQPFSELGRTATEVLFTQLGGAVVEPAPVYVKTPLVQRHSCGCNASRTVINAPLLKDEAVSATWPIELETQLNSLVLNSYATTLSGIQVWKGAQTIVETLEAVLAGTTTPDAARLRQAWQEAAAATHTNNELLQTALTLVNRAARRQQMLRPADAELALRVQTFLEQLRFELVYVCQWSERTRNTYLETLIQNNYEINLALLGTRTGGDASLNWLHHTPVKWGCIGLWTEEVQSGVHEFEIVSVFGERQYLPPLGARYPATSFPSPEHLPPLNQVERDMLVLIPLRTSTREWGVLALYGPIETTLTAGRNNMNQWSTLLSVSIERDTLLHVQAQQQASLQQSLDRERALADTVRELGCPILPLLPGVLLIPLIGALDSTRAQQFIDTMLQGISEHRAHVVLLDITGVPVVDTQVANSLMQATQAATLLGSRIILVGIRPEIAQSIVGLGISLHHLKIEPTLGTALASLLQAGQRQRV